MDKKQFIDELSKLRHNSTFLTLKNYKNEYGEIADHNIIFHMSYKSALQKSLYILSSYKPVNDLQRIAKRELLESFEKSLSNIESTEIEDIDDGYQRFFDNGKYIKGVKLHIASETLHLYGLLVNKKICVHGSYPIRNKQLLTIAKDQLRSLCPVSKFRQYKITKYNVEYISVQGIHLLPPDSV